MSVKVSMQMAEQMMEQIEIIQQLKLQFGEAIKETIPFPKPYCKDLDRIKAIYLGCDPSNTRKIEFEYAFAINHPDRQFKAFVTKNSNNLKEVGLTFDDLYVQNLCQNYFEKETSKNLKVWTAAAYGFWIDYTKKELDALFKPEIPVFLTSKYLFDVLVNKDYKDVSALEFYVCKVDIPIPVNANKLGRPLIPFYRGGNPKKKIKYALKGGNWSAYQSKIKTILNQ